MIKICKYCGNSFEAKRSDAKFCTDKCRTGYYYKKDSGQTFNYKANIKSEKQNNNTETLNFERVDTDKILYSLEKFEQKLEYLYSKRDELKAENKTLTIEIVRLKEELTHYENNLLLRIEIRLNSDDVKLYNNYLSKENLQSKKSKQKESDKFITQNEIDSLFGKDIRYEIMEYRKKLENKLTDCNEKIQNFKFLISTKQQEVEQNKTTIKQYANDINFLQQRIINYDRLLTEINH